MRQIVLCGTLGLTIAAGCAGRNAQPAQVASPPASGQAAGTPTVTRWEYRCIPLPKARGRGDWKYQWWSEQAELAGNGLGAEGWEALSEPGPVWCFKRPLQ